MVIENENFEVGGGSMFLSRVKLEERIFKSYIVKENRSKAYL